MIGVWCWRLLGWFMNKEKGKASKGQRYLSFVMIVSGLLVMFNSLLPQTNEIKPYLLVANFLFLIIGIIVSSYIIRQETRHRHRLEREVQQWRQELE